MMQNYLPFSPTEMVHKEVLMFEPKLRQINAGISGVAQDLQRKMRIS